VLYEKEFTKLAADTDGFSGADLKALCTDAAMGPIRQLGSRALEVDANDVPPISYKHFRQALRGMHPSVAQADLEIYLEWNKTYGSKSMPMMDDEDEEYDSDKSDAKV
jgi:SpoVK/Ycf46/Vps4 family AAA+-type ATPase